MQLVVELEPCLVEHLVAQQEALQAEKLERQLEQMQQEWQPDQ